MVIGCGDVFVLFPCILQWLRPTKVKNTPLSKHRNIIYCFSKIVIAFSRVAQFNVVKLSSRKQ